MIAIRPARGATAIEIASTVLASRKIVSTVIAAAVVSGCAVRLQAPDEPIRFDVNVNITEQKRLEIDQELLALIRRNPELFGLTQSDLSETAN